MTTLVGSIVEGHGEVAALPILVRRIAAELFARHDVGLDTPFRVPRGKFPKLGELDRAARVISARTSDPRILVICDADHDCAVELAAKLRSLITVNSRVEIAIAVCEFEAWFLTAAESLASHPEIVDAVDVPNAESISGAKERLSGFMTTRYSETIHQPAFAARLNLVAARQSRSFEHFVQCIGRLVNET